MPRAYNASTAKWLLAMHSIRVCKAVMRMRQQVRRATPTYKAANKGASSGMWRRLISRSRLAIAFTRARTRTPRWRLPAAISARLGPDTGLDVLALSDDRTSARTRDGSAMFDVGYLSPGQLFEVGTPYGAVDFQEPGLYNVGFDNNGSVLVSVLSGVAQVVGLGGSGRISKGQLLTLVGQTAGQVALSSLNRNDAGYLVDDYYRYQYPNYYDGRYQNYDAYLSDPYYYDPYRRNVSYQYAPAFIPGSERS